MNTGSTGSKRAAILIAVGTVAILLLTVLYVLGLTYKAAYGSSVNANKYVKLSTVNGQPHATLALNIVQQVGTGPHADWLGYQTPDGKSPGTIFHVPAHGMVTIIIHNYDSQTALRNPFFTQVQGTVGGVEYVNGKPLQVMDPSVTSHTFTIPDLGVTVPMRGIASNAKPGSFETMKFTFRTQGAGVFRWQCIVPCGSGLYGFSGPMQEVGYMDGIISVG